MRHDALPFKHVVQTPKGFVDDGRREAAMCYSRVPAHVAAQGDERVELARLGVVQAEHVVQEPRLQERRELRGHSCGCQGLPAE